MCKEVTQEQALEALDRLYGQGCAACDQNNEEGFCAEDDFLVVSQYIEGQGDRFAVALDGLSFIAQNWPDSPAQEILFQIEPPQENS